MPVDFMIDLPCEPKRRLGEAALLDRLRQLSEFREAPSPTAEDAAAARELAFELRAVSFHCARCPANAMGEEFGCYGVVPLPFSAEAEEWLVDLLPAGLKPNGIADEEERRRREAAGELIWQLRHRGVDGSRLDEARDSLADRSRPVEKRYGTPLPLLPRTRVRSSQLLQALFLEGTVDHRLAEPLCRALGVWAEGGRSEDGLPEAVFTQPVAEDDDPCVAGIKRFLHAAMVAASMELGVRTHVSGEVTGEAAL
jgi:hypothetical protein